MSSDPKFRTRRLLVNVTPEAYRLLQEEAVRLDRHASNLSSDIVEAALQALKYSDPEYSDELTEWVEGAK